MNAPAAPLLKATMTYAAYWETIWSNLVLKLPEAKDWKRETTTRTDRWHTIFQIVHKTENLGLRIVQWDPQFFVRDVITWIETGRKDELMIAIKPSKQSFKEASKIIKDWVSAM